MNPAPRRGWCPGIGRPMPTGDGLLVRVHPPAGVLDAAQARAVAEAAALGNGLIDVTARANLQIRGVTERTHGRIAARLSEAGLGDVRADGGPQRLTLASPLATLDPALMALVEAIEAAGRAVPGLPAKALVAVEGRGLGAVEADIRVRAVGPSDLTAAMRPAPRSGSVALATAGGPLWTAPIRDTPLTHALAALLRGFAASGARRLRDLGETARAELLAAAGLAPAAAPPPEEPPPPGPHPLPQGGPALLAEFPFGRCDAALLAALAGLSERHGDGRLRLTPWRGAMLAARDAPAAAALDAAARDLDLIVAAQDPRRAVAACPGAPACASGGTPAQAHAARLAARLGPRPAGRIHVSGCPKGCAHPGRADLTLVGRPDGRYGVVHGGHAGDPEAMVLTFEAVLERLNSPGAALHPDREPA